MNFFLEVKKLLFWKNYVIFRDLFFIDESQKVAPIVTTICAFFCIISIF